MEDFPSIQGEGFYQGYPAYFIRLAGCNVGCTWCDVKESWDAEAHPLVDIETVAERAAASGTQIAVVTGGEPAMYDLAGLTSRLRQRGMRTHIETSGAYPVTGNWDWMCLSPKKFKVPQKDVYLQAHELKVIVYNKSDFRWALDQAYRVRPDCRLYLQPEWSREKEILPAIMDFVSERQEWKISLQIHKYINVP